MRNADSTSKWITIALVAILGIFAWNSLHETVETRAPPAAKSEVPAPASEPAAESGAESGAEAPTETPIEPASKSTGKSTAKTGAKNAPSNPAPTTVAYPAFLPREAIDTLRLIARGGPYPYRQDDGVFQNRERRLPSKPRGYYREYTVKTPGSPDRGARRIVVGGQPPAEYFYTEDHYRSFRRFTLDGTEARR